MYSENIGITIDNAVRMRDRKEHDKAVTYLQNQLKDADAYKDKIALLVEMGRTLAEMEELNVAFDVFIRAYDIIRIRIDSGESIDEREKAYALEILNALSVISKYTNSYSKNYFDMYTELSKRFGDVFNGNADYLNFKGYCSFNDEFVNAVNNIGLIGSNEFVVLCENTDRQESGFIKALWSMIKGNFNDAIEMKGYDNTPLFETVALIRNVALEVTEENGRDISEFKEVYDIDNIMLGVVNALAEILVINEEYEGAIRLIDSIKDSRRYESRINYIKAMAYFRLGKNEEASEILIAMERMYGEFMPLFTVYADYAAIKKTIEGKYLFWGSILPKELTDGYGKLLDEGLSRSGEFIERFKESKGFRNAARFGYIYGYKRIAEVTAILAADDETRRFLMEMLIMSAYDNGVAKLAIQSSIAPYVDEIRYTYHRLYVAYRVDHNVGLSEEFDTARYIAAAYVALKDVRFIDSVDGIVKTVSEIDGEHTVWKTVVTVLGALFDYSEIKDIINVSYDEFLEYMREYNKYTAYKIET